MQIQLFTWSTCSFCDRARELLEQSELPWTEQPLDGDRAALDRMAEWFGTRTMPYVLLDGEPLGGLDELRRLLEGGSPASGA